MIRRAIIYNRIEIFLIVSLLLMQGHGEIWPVALWLGLALSAWWVVMTGTQEAQEHAEQMVRHKQLYLQDTVTGGLLLLVLAYIVRAEQWYFPVMFVLASVQHMRYTYMIWGWMKDNEQSKHTDDSMP